jgi:uncharacterized membrane protein YphA (DoxX/SURF4 family)
MSVRRIFATTAPAEVILIRLVVGCVFLSEGIQKFLFPAAMAAGRFAKIGIPWPNVMGPFVGTVELVGGILVLSGLLTRVASLLLVCDMVVAITSTKLPMLLGHGLLGFADPAVDKRGFWVMAHESRVDFAMLLGALFLLLEGAGRWSLDAQIGHRGSRGTSVSPPVDQPRQRAA